MIIDCHSHHICAPYNTNYLLWAKRTGHSDYGPAYLWNNPIFENIEKRLDVMRHNGIDYSVITYSANIVQIVDSAVDKNHTHSQIVSDINQKTHDIVLKYPSKIGATAWIDLRLGDAALKEMENTSTWALGYSVLTAYRINGKLKLLDDSEFIPFWEKAAKLKKPVFIHFSSLYSIKDKECVMPGYMNDSMFHAGMEQLIENTYCLSRLVMSGIFDKYPSLKVVMGQLGGMYPFMLDRFDMLYTMHLNGALAKGMNVTDPKNEDSFMRNYKNYRDNIYVDTHSMSESAIRCATEILGADKILFGSDLPITPASFGIEHAINQIKSSKMSNDIKENIFSNNARRLLNI